jgi:hypothetical protein
MIETRCAVCRLSDGLILNIIIALTTDIPPDGCELVEVMNEQPCDIGWFYANGIFNGPRRFAVCNQSDNMVTGFIEVSYVSANPMDTLASFFIQLTNEMVCGVGYTWDGIGFIVPVGEPV